MNNDLGGFAFGMALAALAFGIFLSFAADCRLDELEDWRRESECRQASDETACLRDLLEASR